MFHFVSMVVFEGRLLAMTQYGAMWRFEPGFDVLSGKPVWTRISDGPPVRTDSDTLGRAEQQAGTRTEAQG